jgi:hypothetical protein
MGDAVGAKYGDTWRKIRKHFDPEFAYHPTVQGVPRFMDEIHQWIREITPDASLVINAKQSFKFLTFRLLAVQLYGEAFDEKVYWKYSKRIPH